MRYDWISEVSINRAGHWFAILFWLTWRERAENNERVK